MIQRIRKFLTRDAKPLASGSDGASDQLLRPGNVPAPDGIALRPATPAEERYAMAERLTPQVYAIPRLFRIEGTLDADRLADAVDQLIARHPALRTGFVADAAGQFHAYVLPSGQHHLERIDLPGADVAAINSWLRPLLMRKPDLSVASLSAYHLIRVAPELHYFSFSNHHSISDGQSARNCITEIFALYRGEDPGPPAPPLSDMIPADWVDDPRFREQQAWWDANLTDTPEQVDLPPDLDWPDGPEVAAIDVDLPASVTDAMRSLSRRLELSEFTIAYALVLNLLARLSGQDDVLSAFQSNGRRNFPQSARSIGAFSNALILRAPIDWQQDFATQATQTGKQIRAAIDHELAPYHHVIRSTGAHPRFGMNWYPAPDPFDVSGLKLSDASHDMRESDYQLNFRFLRDGDARRLVLYYRAHDISQPRAELLIAQFQALTLAFAANPHRPMAEIRLHDLMPLPQHPELAADHTVEPITAAFLRKVADTPDATAIIAPDATFSYAQLAARAGGTIAALDAADIGSDSRIAILADRDAALIANLLGTSIRGNSFCILDGAYPDQRLQQMLSELAPAAIIAPQRDDLLSRADDLAQAAGCIAVGVDPVSEGPVTAPSSTTERPAYFLFTSGTTGEPKGLAIGHGPLVRFVRWQIERFDLGAQDRFSFLSGLAHDPGLRDIFTPLSAGACLLIPTQDDILQPAALPRWLAHNRPDVCHLTPALGELMLAGADEETLQSLRLLFWGGDMLRPALLKRFAAIAPDIRHVNFYGATETPQAATCYPVDSQMDDRLRSIPVGWASAGHVAQVVDTDGHPCAAYEPGEIEIRAAELTLGRLQQGQIQPLTDPGCHRTGDRGLHLADGAIQLAGRLDDQVKIRGFRIEPAEVASALEAHDAVARAFVLAMGEGADKRLVAFSVDGLDADKRNATLGAFLADRLPLYMLPAQFVALDALPLLPNGKIDRNALRQLADEDRSNRQTSTARPATIAEEKLIEAWQQVLGRSDIAPGDSLVSLGGDSLNFVNLYLATEDALGSVPDGWQVMSIAELSASDVQPERFWRWADSSMVTRAAAITIVVAEHLAVLSKDYFGGSTTGLFLVTGYFFGALQLSTAFANERVLPLLRMMVNLLIPVMLFSVANYSWESWRGANPHISMLLLIGNFYEYYPVNEGHAAYLWYIYAMVQIMLGILLATWLALRLAPGWITAWRFSWILFAIGIALRFGLPWVFIPDFDVNGVQEHTIWVRLPNTYFATVMLGVLVALANTRERRLLLVVALLAYAITQKMAFPGWGGIYLMIFGLMLLFVRRVPLPPLVSRLVLPVSGASLFIYMTHFRFANILRRAGVDAPILEILFALLCGVVLWRLYSWAAARVTQRLRHHSTGKNPMIEVSAV